MLDDKNLMRAVANIQQRSERHEDLAKLVGTYVDVGLLPQLENRNHHIFYGRRGTGKTHVMKVLDANLRAAGGNVVAYIDCRTLGSTSQFSDLTLPMGQRCLSLFRDLLLTVQNVLLQYIADNSDEKQEAAFQALGEFGAAMSEKTSVKEIQRTVQKESASRLGFGGKGEFGAKGIKGVVSAESADEGRLLEKIEESTVIDEKIVFPDLNASLSKVLSVADRQLFILIDEWSSLPIDIQPFLAEFIKRGVLPNNKITVKISALEHRSRFREDEGERRWGFELGADIATAPDLDDYYVYDRNPEKLTSIFADILYKHLNAELPESYFAKTLGVHSGDQLASRLFTERGIFAELARASEGVMRDLINIFTKSYFHAHRRGRDSIDKKAVLESARQWFEQDKAQQLDPQLQNVLSRIVKEVIGNRKARSFMLPRDLEKHPVVQRLFDSRVLHHMQRGYADKDNPGQRYNIYAIDYGAYVDLIGTAKQPELDLTDGREGLADFIVPFDDKRSIRRIILDRAVLEA